MRTQVGSKRVNKIDYRDFAIELVEEGLLSDRKLLIACLKYMPQDDVKAMLKSNEFNWQRRGLNK